jgi:hypothetical protein
LPEETPGKLNPFQLDPESLVHDYFIIRQVSRKEMDDLYREPLFFKAVRAHLEPAVIAGMVEAETRRIGEEQRVLAEIEERERKLKEGESAGEGVEPSPFDARKRAEIEPSWLFFGREDGDEREGLKPGEIARKERPRILASFSSGMPCLIERDIGRGQVLFFASGVFSNWNTLTRTNATLIFDRIFRTLLLRTLPRRNLETVSQFLLPIDPTERRARFALFRPGGDEEVLTPDALGGDSYGLTIRHLARRGHYRVTARRQDGGTQERIAEKLWEVPLAVNGPQEESELEFLDRASLAERMGDGSYRFISPTEEITLEGAQVRGQNLWRWILILLLGCLLVELLILGWPVVYREREA